MAPQVPDIAIPSLTSTIAPLPTLLPSSTVPIVNALQQPGNDALQAPNLPVANGAAASITMAPSASPQPASLDTPPVEGPDCVPYQCNLFYNTVLVYYYGPQPTNTACAWAHDSPPLPPLVADNAPPPDNVVVIIPSVSANNGCAQVGATYASVTKTVPIGDMSTVNDAGATLPYNFNDLPCGPIQTPPSGGQGYEPILAPNPILLNLNAEFKDCILGAGQGKDGPFIQAQVIGGITGPGSGFGLHPLGSV